MVIRIKYFHQWTKNIYFLNISICIYISNKTDLGMPINPRPPYIHKSQYDEPFRQPITDLPTFENLFFFFFMLKLWKVVQSKVELMRINFKFESPIIQAQIITYIIYYKCACVWHQLGGRNNGNINTYFSSHSRQVNVATWFLVLPIGKNPYRLSSGWYILYIYINV